MGEQIAPSNSSLTTLLLMVHTPATCSHFFLNLPRPSLPPQNLCTCCSLCLELFSLSPAQLTLTYTSGLSSKAIFSEGLPTFWAQFKPILYVATFPAHLQSQQNCSWNDCLVNAIWVGRVFHLSFLFSPQPQLTEHIFIQQTSSSQRVLGEVLQ